jgi:hypothetical protein
MRINKEAEEANARLEEAAAALERMAKELRRLKTTTSGKTKVQADLPKSGADAGVQVGQRVRVIRKDQYRGRTGVVLGRHGRLFWDVQLDASGTHKECTIYKRESSLCVLVAAE